MTQLYNTTKADHLPQYSLDFEASSSQILFRLLDGTASGAAFGEQFSIAFRFKRETTGVAQYIFEHRGGGFANGMYVNFSVAGRLKFLIGAAWSSGGIGTIQNIYVEGSTKVNDTNWHDALIVVDLPDATKADRIRIYLDGVRETAFKSLLPSVSTALASHKNGRFYTGFAPGVGYYDGLLYNFGIGNGNAQWAVSDVRESDGTAKDLKDLTDLYMHPDLDAGEVPSDWLLSNWANINGITASTIIGDAAT